MLAGPIVDALSYHWLFWLPSMLVAVGDDRHRVLRARVRSRSPGASTGSAPFLLSGWLVCLLVGISEGSAWGWGDPRTSVCCAAAAILLVLWVANELRAESRWST